jgi:hypothetical protein
VDDRPETCQRIVRALATHGDRPPTNAPFITSQRSTLEVGPLMSVSIRYQISNPWKRVVRIGRIARRERGIADPRTSGL